MQFKQLLLILLDTKYSPLNVCTHPFMYDAKTERFEDFLRQVGEQLVENGHNELRVQRCRFVESCKCMSVTRVCTLHI